MKVAITKCEDYTQEKVDAAVKKACLSAGFPDVSGKKVLLKPNILSDAPLEKAITTNPAVVKAVIHLLRELGAKEILLGDSPGLQVSGSIPKDSGMADICREEKVSWVDFTDKPVVREVPFTRGMRLPFAHILGEVDILISLPKFKTHKLMYATGAMKNQFGTIPSIHKSACHVKCVSRGSFANLIVGINALVKPDFAVMDAIIGMEGAGPANGMPRHVGLLLASSDLVALDIAEAAIMGYDPMDIPVIASALKHKTGGEGSYPLLDPKTLAIKDWDRVEIEKGSHLFRNLILPAITRPFAKMKAQKLRPAPQFGQPSCILCLRCVRICPAKALTVEDKKVVIDTRRCVRCYCCHEICPKNAIVIEENH